MLEQLIIKNFAIIEDLEVDFNSGFVSLCGETGAGKSIIIDAISLLMGQRSSFDKIRLNKNKAFIEGVFSVSNDLIIKQIEEILDEELLDNTIVLSRSLDINGKSIAKINSRTVSISTLKAVTSLLIDIHSQQHDNDYLHKSNQLSLLDNFILKNVNSEEKAIINEYKNLYKEYKNITNEINVLKEKQDLLGQEDYLLYQKNELEKANIQPHEMEDLEEEKSNLNEFSRQSERIISFLNEYESVSSALYNAKKQLSYIDQEEYRKLSEKFSSLYFEIEDLHQEIESKFEKDRDSLLRLEQINDRLFFLHTLRKKYGYTTDDILNRYQEIISSLDDIKNYENNLLKLENELKIITLKCYESADKITSIRIKYSEILSNEINNQLNDLYLENAEFKVEINRLNELNLTGIDDITFLLKANAGLGFSSLEKSASLGETSRLNLALKTVFNKLNKKETIIFDEIDIGISGRVALAVSKKMKEISLLTQVIAISHLPQVCATSDYQYLVKKEVINDSTYSSIELLNEEQRVIEISKMLTGEVNSTSIKLSKELIESLTK